MKKIDKKTASLFVIALCFIIGGSLSFESMARFTKKIDGVNKSIKVGEFKVDAQSDFASDDTIKPGDTLSADTITLKNENSYPVEFTISIKNKSIETKEGGIENEQNKNKTLLDYLTLSIDGVDITNYENSYKIELDGITDNKDSKVKTVNAEIKWNSSESDEIDFDTVKNDIANYTYDIKAKQISKNGSNSGGNGNSGEGNGGANPDQGNNGNEGGESGEETPPSNNDGLSTINLNDISWKATTTSNQSKIEVTDNYTIVGTNSNAVLENFKFDFRTEKIIFNADIELLNVNNTEGKGLNFAIGVKESNDSTRNRLTYQIYKAKEVENENIYAKVTNVINPLFPNEISREGNGGRVIETLKVKLNGEITKNGDFLYSKLSITDERGNVVSSGENAIQCGEYKDTDKLYINISSIMGKEGIKINSMEVKSI